MCCGFARGEAVEQPRATVVFMDLGHRLCRFRDGRRDCCLRRVFVRKNALSAMYYA
ncbi:hypothetical protein CHELA40_13869 [Chelatococcus asaccharovorans]|nr:hypothetical protein CHELA40_13869 [Chelatococcus asaccharovorans]CAH1675072.1 hypothetical protein CHELA17_61759 [Chelatococcus asaccharovorans]